MSAEQASGIAPKDNAAGKKLIFVLAIAMAVLHQDFWLWDDATLVFGFMPAGLAYHATYSIVAALLWALAIKIAWPHELEAMAEGDADAVITPTESFDQEEATDGDGVGEF